MKEVSYNKMFNPKTMGNLKSKSSRSAQDLTGNKNPLQIAMKMAKLLPEVIEAEEGYTDELEQLAVQIVKDSYPIIEYAGINIDARITPHVEIQDFEGEPIEDAGGPKFDEMKRQIINSITHGAAQRGTFNYMILRDYIDQLDPNLVVKYTDLMKHVFGVFDNDQAIAMMLAMLAQQKKIEGGSEEVTWDEDGGNLTIHARAVCFPMLVHEIVKGLYEILSLQGFGADKERNKQVVRNVDKLQNEPEDMRYGKFIYDTLSNVYNESNIDDPRVRELFFTEVYKLDDDQFKLFIDNAINGELTNNQKRWAVSVMQDIEKDLKKDDTGLDEIKQIPTRIPAVIGPSSDAFTTRVNGMELRGSIRKDDLSEILCIGSQKENFHNYLKDKNIPFTEGGYLTYIPTIYFNFRNKNKLDEEVQTNKYLTYDEDPEDKLYLQAWYKSITPASEGKYSLENSLLEYSEKIMAMLRKRYKAQSTNLQDEMVNYYVSRFDQLKNSIRQRYERGDSIVKEAIPKELQPKNEQDLRYLDITQWRHWKDLEKIIDVFPAPPSVQKAAAEETANTADTDADLIYKGDNVEIYQGDSKSKCIRYGHGQKDYSWCISRPGASNYYDNYRFMGKESRMFYFVFDRSRSSRVSGKHHAGFGDTFDDPYHAIAIHVFERGGYAITNANNSADNDSKTWEGLAKYMPSELWNKIKGLKDKFKYIQPSPEEMELQALKGAKLTLDQFKNLSYNTKLVYINGENELTPEQIETLDTELKNQYINVGNVMPFYTIKTNLPLIKRYIKIQFERKERPVAPDYLEYMDEDDKQKYFAKYKDEQFVTHGTIEKYFPDYLPQYIKEYIEKLLNLPSDWVSKYMTPEQQRRFYLYSPAYDNTPLEESMYNSKTMITDYFSISEPLNLEKFKEIDDRQRIAFMNFTKDLIQKNKIDDYPEFLACLPDHKIDSGGTLLFNFDGDWYDANVRKSIREDFEKYSFQKRAGLIK